MLYSAIMRYSRTGFWLALALLVLSTASYPGLAAAAPISIKNDTSKTLVASAEDWLLEATVNLYCRVKVGNKEVSVTGTGVVIDARGVILTNAHVAQYFLLNGKDSKLSANCTVRAGSPAKDRYVAEVLYISKEWLSQNTEKSVKASAKGTGEHDYALLYVTKAKKGNLPAQFPIVPLGLATLVNKGGEVTVGGYPAGSLKYKDVRNKLKLLTATTTITSLQTFEAQTTDLITLSRSKVASYGVSGGPVTSSGQVIGIVATMSTSKGTDEGASLRAITLSYINRAVMDETGLSLTALYSGDLTTRAALTRASITADTLAAIERPLRTSR